MENKKRLMKLCIITKALGLDAYIEDDEWKDDEYDNTHLVVTDYSNFKKFIFEIWPTNNKKKPQELRSSSNYWR